MALRMRTLTLMMWLVAVAAVARPAQAPATKSGEKTGAGLANPASVNCGKLGGKTIIRKDSEGGEIGFCAFPDHSECEEWALMRGKCKHGDNKPNDNKLAGRGSKDNQHAAKAKAGLANPASVNCGKMSGKTVIRKDSKGGEVGYCDFTDGSECEEWALMRGKCKPGDYKPKPAPAPPAKKP